MYNFEKIKLVIWDLDDTFWNGILSEGNINPIQENIDLIKTLTDIGIINSICSKNDILPVKNKLDELELSDYFIHISVDWQPKGERIKNLIDDLQLRPANVLFIDDNHSNLEETKFYCPEIMTISPKAIHSLITDAIKAEKKDIEHKRLKQYKVLESKLTQKSSFSSNEEFLFNSNIRVEIKNDCMSEIDRIHELILRSNQLNFTKIRSAKEDLLKTISDSQYNCGYVTVSDNFGDYGIVGFYALKDNNLLHFTFSCRTLGMGIEQYVYSVLNRPKLQIVGEVVSSLNTECPIWINQKSADNAKNEAQSVDSKILIKGPCDLFQILPYIANKSSIDTEFTFVNDKGVTVESTGHTTHIVEAMRLNEAQKDLLCTEIPFADIAVYNDNIYKNNYGVVIISILSDANLGVYRRKGTGEKFAFVEGYHPITDSANWESYINGEYNSCSVKFTRAMLQDFADKYEFVGINSPEQIAQNLKYVRQHLPKTTTMIVMLGGELKYEKNTFPAYENRHIVHKQINDEIREMAAKENIKLIDVNKHLTDQSCFYDHFNHYIKPIYYKLAEDIVQIINDSTSLNLKNSSKINMLLIRTKEFLAPFYYKLRKLLNKQ